MDRNARLAFVLSGVVTTMVGLSFAAVPLYDWFCRVTGYGGETAVASEAPDIVLDREVTIRFDASKDRDMAWEFRPLQREMSIRLGDSGLAFYEAHNPTDRPIAGTASFNVTPFSAGGYFTKVHCFCFELQVLQPGETVQMPVSFFVDPEMVADAEAKGVHTITLSYTFYETELPEDAAAFAPEPTQTDQDRS